MEGASIYYLLKCPDPDMLAFSWMHISDSDAIAIWELLCVLKQPTGSDQLKFRNT